MIKDVSFGALLKEVRIKNRVTLRQYCLKRGFDSGNISRLERNLIAPPQTKRQLMKYLEGLTYDEFYYEMLRTAAVNHHIAKVILRWDVLS